MASTITLNQFSDERGVLTVVEKIVPFPIKRVFFINEVPDWAQRGGHRHHITHLALICVTGSCTIDWKNEDERGTVELKSSEKCLLLEPRDFHYMRSFAPGTSLLVLASEYFDKDDYVYEEPASENIPTPKQV